MMFLIGFSMMGGYFGLLKITMPFAEQHFPGFTVLTFVLISVVYAVLAMRLQTRIERRYIRRHTAKNPDSGWRVVSEEISAKS